MSTPTELPRRTGLRVVLFSGGSGTKSIGEYLARHPQVQLTILINCYDDGHSTGRLRRFIPGMLGPSDVRKNIGRLAPTGQLCHEALRFLSEHRLPVGTTREQALPILRSIAAGDLGQSENTFAPHWRQLSVHYAQGLAAFAQAFLAYEAAEAAQGRFFDYTDCALGNIYFAGCYLRAGRNFNAAVADFSNFYEVKATLLNITLGENLFLIAEKADGTFFLNEADLVGSSADIARISLVSETDAQDFERSAQRPREWLTSRIRAAEVTPELNPQAAQAIDEADVIIYGPGTQHSSLFPSYLTRGLGAHIAANRGADKIFILNIRRDADIRTSDANDLAGKLLEAMRRGVSESIEWRDCVTHFFVQQTALQGSDPVYVPFDRNTFQFPLDTVYARDWEGGEGRHEGGYIFSELREIVQSRIQIDLAPRPFLVSIVVPALNAEATIEAALRGLMTLDFSAFELGKEVIVVDSGSTDRTVEFARRVRGVKVIEADTGKGKTQDRGATLRRGIAESRGNYIVFFTADGEYNPNDLVSMVNHLREGQCSAVFGTRNTKVLDLSAHLRRIYENHPFRYRISKYGGLTISILTLILFNRYISDVLTSCAGFNASMLRSLNLQSAGYDLNAEIVAKLCRSRQYILEVPVEFQARPIQAGNKMRVVDGVRTIWGLFRYRFGALS